MSLGSSNHSEQEHKNTSTVGNTGLRRWLPNAREAAQILSPPTQKRLEDGVIIRRPKELVQVKVPNQLYFEEHFVLICVKSLRLETFRYAPLPHSSSIRLLILSPGGQNEVIRCSVNVVDLKESPQYTALSYAWQKDKSWTERLQERASTLGSKALENSKAMLGFQRMMHESSHDSSHQDKDNHTDTRTIFCDGQVLKICSSLYDALLRLRRYHNKAYWIDAICINQADDEEKSSQVAMMGHIYNTAESVVVWLGLIPTYLSPGFEKLNSWLDRNLNGESRVENQGDPTPKTPLISDEELVIPMALVHLISRRYFSRIWVLQEIALARQVTFLLGEHEFGPQLFSKAIQFIDLPSTHAITAFNLFSSVVPKWSARIKTMPFPRGREHAAVSQAASWSLFQWLQVCVGRHAFDTRDLVFAGLSLVHLDFIQIRRDLQLQPIEPPPLPPRPGMITKSLCISAQNLDLWHHLHVDYTATVHEVLFNLAACILSGQNGIDLLSISAQLQSHADMECYDYERPNLMPSWMPVLVPWSIHVDVPLVAADTTFGAATKMRNDPKLSSDGLTLFLDGARLGTVETRLLVPGMVVMNEANSTVTGPTDMDDTNYILDFFKTLKRLPHDYRDAGRSTLAAITDAITHGIHRHDPLELSKLVFAFSIWLDSEVRTSGKGLERLDKPTRTSDKVLMPFFESDTERHCREECNRSRRQQLEDQEKLLPGVFNAVKELYPEIPWPTSGVSYNEEEKEALNLYRSHYLSYFRSPKRIFTTNSGYIGLGMTGVREGDVVMLIRGGRVPYILRHKDDALRAQAKTIERNLSLNRKNYSKEKVEGSIRDIERLRNQIGQTNEWVLVGEAYIGGVMDGEAVARYMDKFERLSIV